MHFDLIHPSPATPSKYIPPPYAANFVSSLLFIRPTKSNLCHLYILRRVAFYWSEGSYQVPTVNQI